MKSQFTTTALLVPFTLMVSAPQVVPDYLNLSVCTNLTHVRTQKRIA